MNMIASYLAASQARLGGAVTAEVLLCMDEDLLLVEHGATRLQARRALSCLIELEPGDIVLLGGEADRPFVLALLERRGDKPLRLVLTGDAEIHAARGRLSFSGEQGLALSSSAKVEISAPEISVVGRSARFLLHEITHIGRSITSHASRLKLIGETLESTMQEVVSRVRRSFRMVEEVDIKRSGGIDHRAEGTLHLSGQNAIVTASTIAKVDAGQIHLG